jgi:hypothetical protein
MNNMTFIKNNIKIISFIVAFIVIIILFTIFLNREVTYTVEYDVNEYHIKETYTKGSSLYSFNVTTDNHEYDYAINHKYSRKRKLVSDINSFDRDDYKCVGIKAYGIESNVICNKDNDYYDNIILNVDDGKPAITNGFAVYNDEYDFIVWNGYGFTNKRDNTTYNFLSDESYTNNLSYQFGDYIIVADYDQKREFSKFYIYNHKTNKVDEWNIKTTISFDSYFMGNIGDDLYLFDVSTKTQYRMNIAKKKIKVSSKNGEAVFFDKIKSNINVNKLYYNKILFKYDKLYNFLVFDNKLYYNYYNSNKDIRVSDLDIKDIVTYGDDSVFFISGTKLYRFNTKEGIKLLADSFEWNFDYKNKIYVYPR